jgi:survival-of-motor-neuron-related-splicing factor 30
MADIKALKDAIWLKKEEIKKEEQGLADWSSQVSLAAADMLRLC